MKAFVAIRTDGKTKNPLTFKHNIQEGVALPATPVPTFGAKRRRQFRSSQLGRSLGKCAVE